MSYFLKSSQSYFELELELLHTVVHCKVCCHCLYSRLLLSLCVSLTWRDDSLPRIEFEFVGRRRERVNGFDVSLVGQNHFVFVLGAQECVSHVQRRQVELQAKALQKMVKNEIRTGSLIY